MLTSLALEQERALLAERLLLGIERRHGLPHHSTQELHPQVVDRFLVAYLPEMRDGEPAPQTLEFAFTPTATEAVEILRRVVTESPYGWGSACYIHDLDTGATASHG